MKPFCKFLLLLGGLLLGYGPASAQLFEWAKLAHNKGNNSGFAGGGTTDVLGNTTIGFVFKDSARVGGQLLRATNGTQAVVQYDSLGRVNWVKQLADVFLDSRGLVVDPTTRDIFVTGRFSANPRWGAVAVAGGGRRNFYGKISFATGALTWVNSLPLQLNVTTSVAADGLGNFYLMSEVDSVVQLGGMRLDSTRMFLLGAQSNGSGQWVNILRGVPASGAFGVNGRPYNGIYSDNGLAARPTGGCMVFGQAIQSVFYSPSATPVLTTNPAAQLNFLLQVSPTGALVQARPGFTVAGAVSRIIGLAVDNAGNFYATGAISSTVGVAVAKYTPAGTLVWATNAEPTIGGFPAAQGEKILVHSNGEVTIQAYTALVANRSPTTIGTLVLTSENNLVHYSASGQPLWAVGDGTGQLPYTPSSRDYGYNQAYAFGADADGNLYWCLEATTSSTTGPGGFSLAPPAARLGSLTVVGAGVLVTRVGTHHNTIRGNLYFDLNGNGVRDTNDVAFPQTTVLAATQGTLNTFSSIESNGNYSMYVGAGNYTLASPTPPLHYVLTQPTSGPYTGNFVGFGNVAPGRDFGFQPVANQSDVRVALTPYGTPRPGFVTRYRLTVENVGTVAASSTATLTLDSHQVYVSSTPSGSRTGQTVTWTYTNLAPFGRLAFEVLGSLPINTALGTSLTISAAAPLANDVMPADNTAGLAQTVSGSFDPNDLTVNYSRLSPAQVAAGLPLDYTVRFQNLGTDTAFTVVVNDTLDFRRLNLSSLQLIAQSHNCQWMLTGTGKLTVRFLDIKLPCRNADVIRSQGFVRFRVLPKTTLSMGEVIANRAGIVFDYNEPVRTNTVTTTVLLPTAVLANHHALAWDVYPNPASGWLRIAAELPSAGPVTLQLLDALGRPVQQHTLAAPAGAFNQALDVSALPPGLYVLQLRLPDGTVRVRQVVRE